MTWAVDDLLLAAEREEKAASSAPSETEARSHRSRAAYLRVRAQAMRSSFRVGLELRRRGRD